MSCGVTQWMQLSRFSRSAAGLANCAKTQCAGCLMRAFLEPFLSRSPQSRYAARRILYLLSAPSSSCWLVLPPDSSSAAALEEAGAALFVPVMTSLYRFQGGFLTPSSSKWPWPRDQTGDTE